MTEDHNATLTLRQTHLNIGAADPAHGGQVVREQQVVSLVVKAPLAQHQVRAAILYLGTEGKRRRGGREREREKERQRKRGGREERQHNG